MTHPGRYMVENLPPGPVKPRNANCRQVKRQARVQQNGETAGRQTSVVAAPADQAPAPRNPGKPRKGTRQAVVMVNGRRQDRQQ